MVCFYPKNGSLKNFIFIFFLLISINAFSQTCTGSVGDPIVNVTFGSGSSQFGPPLPAGSTSSLSYQPVNCPGDGNYAITNYTSGCWPSDVVWHTAHDHSGDPNGYFMLINASYQPSDFYIQTVTGLCEGTQYQFAAWLLNMCSVTGGLPNITMTIEKTDGSVLKSYGTGDIPIINPLTWKQYGFSFSTPANVSTVVLRMRNNAPGGVGNDVGLDDITFRPIGSSVSINAVDITADTASLCESSMNTLQLNSSVEQCYVTTAYQWQMSTDNGATWKDIAGATSSTYARAPTGAGTYWYRLAVAEQNNIGVATCRVTSKPFVVNVYADNVRTIAIFKNVANICEGNAVTFTAQTTNGGNTPTYQWQINGSHVGTNTPVFTNSMLATGDVVNCIFTSSLPCNSPLTSNSIPITVGRKQTVAISHTICEGETYAGYTSSGTYTDTFTGSNGCDSIRVLTLVVNPKQSSSEDTTICYGSNYKSFSASGVYQQTFTGSNGCDSVHTINLTVLPDINRKVWNDTTLCTGDSLLISPGVWDTYLWQDGSTGNHFTVTKGGLYSVLVSNQCGNANKQIKITEQVCNVAFPSAFTPNGDGLNDVFKVVNGYNLWQYHLVIFNRWGQKAFESFNWAKGWDGLINGKWADNGTYIWFCEYKQRGAENRAKTKGTVTLIR